MVAQRNNVNVVEMFPCGFDGSDVSVTWYRNDMMVQEDTSHIMHEDGTLEVTAIVEGVDTAKNSHLSASFQMFGNLWKDHLLKTHSFPNISNSLKAMEM